MKLQRLQITPNKGQEIKKKTTTMLSVDVTIPVICLILLMISACEKAEDDLKTSFSENHHQKDEEHVCSLYIYSDPFLWRQVYLLEGAYYLLSRYVSK